MFLLCMILPFFIYFYLANSLKINETNFNYYTKAILFCMMFIPSIVYGLSVKNSFNEKP
jgi:hypothetical protein